jgi:hypothetical protein
MFPPPPDGRTPAFPPRVGRAIGIGCATLIVGAGAIMLVTVVVWFVRVLT